MPLNNHFQPSSEVPVSEVCFHFKKTKLAWPETLLVLAEGLVLTLWPVAASQRQQRWNCGAPNPLPKHRYFVCLFSPRETCLCLAGNYPDNGSTADSPGRAANSERLAVEGMGEAEIRFRSPLSNKDHTRGSQGMKTTAAIHHLCTMYKDAQSLNSFSLLPLAHLLIFLLLLLGKVLFCSPCWPRT